MLVMIRLVICALGTLSAAVSAQARVIHVPEHAPTVQAGLDSLNDGDTVSVAAGFYAEALIAPPIHFALRGEVSADTNVMFPRPVIDPSPLPGSDSLACLILPNDSYPVMEDLQFQNGPGMFPRRFATDVGGIFSRSPFLILRRCRLDSVWWGIMQDPDFPADTIRLEECRFRGDSVLCVANGWGSVVATDCEFSGWGGMLLFAYSHSRILRCHFRNNADGNLLFAHGENVVVENCIFGPRPLAYTAAVWLHEVRGRLNGCVFTDNCGGGQVLNAEAGAVDSLEISRNVFMRNTTPAMSDQRQPQIWVNWQPNAGHGIAARIEENIMVQCTSAAGATAIYCGLQGLEGGAVINRNRIHDMWPQDEPVILADVTHTNPVTMRENLIWNNGVAVEGSEYVDVRWNWWGDVTGPYHSTRNPLGQGDTIVGNVNFDPWYPDTSFLSIPGIGKPLPEQFLLEAYPNPFNGTVTLKLSPPEVMIVRMDLFDILGRKVKEIWSGPLAFQKPITFDGSDLVSGIYFARVWQPIGNRQLALSKLVLMK